MLGSVVVCQKSHFILEHVECMYHRTTIDRTITTTQHSKVTELQTHYICAEALCMSWI